MPRGKFQASTGDRTRLHDLPNSADDLPETVSVNLDDKDPNNIQVVEIDDTPQEDRGRPTEVEHPLDVQEEDLRNLSATTQKRINRLKFETETERRGREAAQRERDAAVALIRDRDAEIARYRQSTDAGNTALANSMVAERQARIADATRRLEQAHMEGDGAKIAKATSDLGMAQAELVAIQTRQPAPQPVQQQQQPVQQQPQRTAPSIAPRALSWVQKNGTWFDPNGGNEKSRDALDINRTLTERGVDPNSEAYTRELDRRLKALYPDHTPFDMDGDRQGSSTPRRANTVADSSRESEERRPANPRTVELTRSELSIAKRLNVTPQAYAAEKLKRMQRDSQNERGAR